MCKKVRFEPSGIQVEVKHEASLLELALNNNVDIDNSCGGSGSCGTCRVKIKQNVHKLADRNDVEKAMADDRGFSDDERLACQIEPIDALVVEVP